MTLTITPGYQPNISPKEWMLSHYTDFPSWVEGSFAPTKAQKDDASTCNLFKHQQFIKNYIGSENSPYRGILLYHGLGTGKTISSISVAESLSLKYEIVVMLPASLVRNYINEIISCGNYAFNNNKHWTFYDFDHDKFNTISSDMQSLGVDSKLINKNKGVWGFSDTLKANFTQLSGNEQLQITAQIESMIKKRYRFIHYNGVSAKRLRELGRDFFENKVVIIDEIHNFISAIQNKRQLRRIMYDMLMDTQNVKIIGLSGTPFINSPHELAFMANLLHGYISTFVLTFQGNKQFNERVESMQNMLRNHRLVDHFDIQQSGSTIRLKLVPSCFERTSSTSHYVKRSDACMVHQTVIDVLIKDMEQSLGLTLKRLTTENSLLLPEDPQQFAEMFIGETTDTLKNKKVLARRLQGLISYYESYDRSKFPTQSEIQIVRIDMPGKVFAEYESVRDKEREQERDQQKKAQRMNRENKPGAQEKALNVYRAFSRALCLYCFPDTIKRVYPSDMRKLRDEIDDIDHSVSMNSNSSSRSRSKSASAAITKSPYDVEKDKMMRKLRRNASLYLTGEGLKTYGAKYYEVLKRLETNPGLSVIYSHFRQIEGLGIMQEVLDYHGYKKLDVVNSRGTGWILDIPKDDNTVQRPFYIVFSQDKAKNKILIDLYNSDFAKLPQAIQDQVTSILRHRNATDNIHGELVSVLMITQSGAEGISLKNVRQVHILEPYWNPIRIKQVIGRAIRINSHEHLKPSERHVDIFMYIMQLGEHLIPQDKNLTSDEVVQAIAQRKGKLVETTLEILRSAAVDCSLNKHAHPSVSCFKLPTNFGKFAYHQGLVANEVTNAVLDQKLEHKVTTITVISVIEKKTGKKIYFIKESGEILDNEAYEHDKQRVIIGIMEKSPTDGKMKPVYYNTLDSD